MTRRTWLGIAAIVLAVAGNVSVVVLRIVNCGPDPVNLWCAREPYLGTWQFVLLLTSIGVGVLGGGRAGLVAVLVGSLAGYVIVTCIDPWVGVQYLGWVGALNFAILGLPAALVGLAVGVACRYIARGLHPEEDGDAAGIRRGGPAVP